jgi:hypothetical protein
MNAAVITGQASLFDFDPAVFPPRPLRIAAPIILFEGMDNSIAADILQSVGYVERPKAKATAATRPAAPPHPTAKATTAKARTAPRRKKKTVPDTSHVWVAAAEVVIEERAAAGANHKGFFKAQDGQRVDVMEVYCRGCRRPIDQVKGQPCIAKVDKTHLIGGDQSTRAPRKAAPVPPPGARILRGGTINRRGVAAYVNGVTGR